MAGIWPGETQCMVMLTFDLDGVSALLNRDPEMARRPSVMSRNEFGLNVGASRILNLLDKYDIRLDRWVDRQPGSYWITPPEESTEDG